MQTLYWEGSKPVQAQEVKAKEIILSKPPILLMNIINPRKLSELKTPEKSDSGKARIRGHISNYQRYLPLFSQIDKNHFADGIYNNQIKV